MNTYEEMLDTAYDEGIIVDDRANLRENEDGYYIQNGDLSIILLNKNIQTTCKRRCRLSEELGHHYTTSGNITDQSKVENRKKERIARAWGYQREVPLTLLLEAIDYPCQNRTELAEYLDVPEDYLMEALKYYKEKYGNYVRIKEHILLFEPLALIKAFE